ncbi:MAG: NTP transferase domain-containing protein [Bryobacteraceae bacterium]|nr:NTP transferase domain-containing protein [Bryobacteraceae bacterium]
MKAVILAGGAGRRLLPYTATFPKPMMPVGHRPVLEIILRQLKAHGIGEVIIATGYLEELIRAYFQDGSKLGLAIEYSREDEPLGTAGPLGLARSRLRESFLLMNGDILTDLDFHRPLAEHRRRNNDVTVILAPRVQAVDYGVVRLADDGTFAAWDEKPSLEYLVSAGIYIMEPGVLDYLPGGFVNLPDFITLLHGAGLRVRGYIHQGYWLDIGRPDDYEKACADAEKLRLC